MTSSPLAMKAMRNLQDNRSPRRYPRYGSMSHFPAMEPDIEVKIDGLLSSIHSVNGAIAGACLSQDGYFSQDEDMRPAMSKTAEQKLTEPLENLAWAFDIIWEGIMNYAGRARNFEQNTVVKAKQTPAAKRKPITSTNIDVIEEAVQWVTKLLQDGGSIDNKYLRGFDHYINETSRLLTPMFDLTALIESIADAANGRPCSIATERAAEADQQARREGSERAESNGENASSSEHAESDNENDSLSDCSEHSSNPDHDHQMPDAAADPPQMSTEPSSSLLPTPPLTSKATTFPQSQPPPSSPPPEATTTLNPSPPHLSALDPPLTPYYITRLTSRGHPHSTLAHPSATDGPIWTRILEKARIALFAANHLASGARSAKEQAHRQKNVWKRMTEYFDERAGLIRRYRAEGGVPNDDPRSALPLSAEEREEHEAAEALRKVEEMIAREMSSGAGHGDRHNEEEEGEMRQRYRRGMQRFEREERWRKSPSIKWTDREDDVQSNDENRGRPRTLQNLDKHKRMPGNRSPAPLGFGKTNTSFLHQGLGSAFDGAGGDVIGRETPPPLATRTSWEIKGKGKMTPQDWEERPGKGMLGEVADPLDDIYAAGSDEEEEDEEEEDKKTRDRLMRSMGGGKWKGG